MYFVYLLECSDRSIYTGITNNLQKRMKEHEEGFVLYTKNRRPFNLLITEEYGTRIGAARREKEIKGWSRNKKQKLVKVYAEEAKQRSGV